jgi:hypothetical protein
MNKPDPFAGKQGPLWDALRVFAQKIQQIPEHDHGALHKRVGDLTSAVEQIEADHEYRIKKLEDDVETAASVRDLARRVELLERSKPRVKAVLAPAKTKAVAKPAKAKASSGNRTERTMWLIGRHPGITAGDLAKEQGIAVNYLYRVLPKLERAGKVRKEGTGYYPVVKS